MTGMFFLARNCRTISDMWLDALSWCRNHFPCHVLWIASHSLCKTCT
jgi:hypothetical protein